MRTYRRCRQTQILSCSIGNLSNHDHLTLLIVVLQLHSIWPQVRIIQLIYFLTFIWHVKQAESEVSDADLLKVYTPPKLHFELESLHLGQGPIWWQSPTRVALPLSHCTCKCSSFTSRCETSRLVKAIGGSSSIEEDVIINKSRQLSILFASSCASLFYTELCGGTHLRPDSLWSFSPLGIEGFCSQWSQHYPNFHSKDVW